LLPSSRSDDKRENDKGTKKTRIRKSPARRRVFSFSYRETRCQASLATLRCPKNLNQPAGNRQNNQNPVRLSLFEENKPLTIPGIVTATQAARQLYGGAGTGKEPHAPTHRTWSCAFHVARSAKPPEIWGIRRCLRIRVPAYRRCHRIVRSAYRTGYAVDGQ
jgi:hypothetical protein